MRGAGLSICMAVMGLVLAVVVMRPTLGAQPADDVVVVMSNVAHGQGGLFEARGE